MKALYRLLLVHLLVMSTANATIKSTVDLSEFKTEVFASNKNDTLVIYDIDMVLLMPTDHIFLKNVDHASKPFLNNIYADYHRRYSPEEVKKLLSIINLSGNERPVTKDTVQIFNKIKDKGYKVLGLTLCTTGMFGHLSSYEEWRIGVLDKYGMQFSPGFPNISTRELMQYIPNEIGKEEHDAFPVAMNGILFACKLPKGVVLKAYLEHAKIKPKKIIFIDDKMSNLESVADFCAEDNINYIGFEYNAVKEYAKNIPLNFPLARLQFAILDTTKVWLGDEQAEKILRTIKYK